MIHLMESAHPARWWHLLAGRPHRVRPVPALLQAARRPARVLFRAPARWRRHGAHHLRPQQRVLRRSDREKTAQSFLSRAPACCRSAPPAATSAADSARTGASARRASSTAWPTAASPGEIARKALDLGCKSVAFTYNDPMIFAEYAIDVADACHATGRQSRGRHRGLHHCGGAAGVLPAHGCRQRGPQGFHRGLLSPPLFRASSHRCSTRWSICNARPSVVRSHDPAHSRRKRQRRRVAARVGLVRRTSRPGRAMAFLRVSSRLQDAR